ncbi:(2Fe-2S)-binding protein [Szabonella alba]|uniref:(2Fe-2S)-binding protein n=1 Tax=Szabonella alba TaxID=2804194 RepID=A0A8K0VBD6_9RHOB|nr:(2Fe-2S)-binding protein [Szabonella alba]MBL4916775.1 (2Fe-2S)-binding protein [Szabonella alba]
MTRPDARITRLAETGRTPLWFRLDGREVAALAGDSVLTAVLANAPALRLAEFGTEGRAGFCLMGACQDCWIWQENGPRIRACSTPVAEGMRLLTRTPEAWP